MGQTFSELSEQHIQFVSSQRIFFAGCAGAEGHVHVSPKGMDSLRVISATRLIWLNIGGSENETYASVLQHPRMTLMFCAFEGPRLILRIYATARAVTKGGPEWANLLALFPSSWRARQIFDLSVESVKVSCGMFVPYFAYIREGDYKRT